MMVCDCCRESYLDSESWRFTEVICSCTQSSFWVCQNCLHKTCLCGQPMVEKWRMAESDCPGYFLDLIQEES